MMDKNQGRAAFIALIQAASLGLQAAPAIAAPVTSHGGEQSAPPAPHQALSRLKRTALSLMPPGSWLR